MQAPDVQRVECCGNMREQIRIRAIGARHAPCSFGKVSDMVGFDYDDGPRCRVQ